MPSTFKKADLSVSRRLHRNGDRNDVFTIRSIDTRPGLARSGFEVELYQDYGAGTRVRWCTLKELKAQYKLLA